MQDSWLLFKMSSDLYVKYCPEGAGLVGWISYFLWFQNDAEELLLTHLDCPLTNKAVAEEPPYNAEPFY